MTRIALITLLAGLVGFAIIIGGAPPSQGATGPAQCIGTPGSTQNSVDCGGNYCEWTGTLQPGVHRDICWGNWYYALVSTTGCCYQGSSYTGFWYNYRDTRVNNISGLRINSQHPEMGQYFLLENDSRLPVWYHVELY